MATSQNRLIEIRQHDFVDPRLMPCRADLEGVPVQIDDPEWTISFLKHFLEIGKIRETVMGEDGIYLDDDGLAGVVADLRSEAAALDEVVVVGDGGEMGYNMDTAASDLGTDVAFCLSNLSSLVTALATALEDAGVSTIETDLNIVRHTGGAVPV